MVDREKVISDFEHEVFKANSEGWDFVDLNTEDAKEILALLKEQEPIAPKLIKMYPHDIYECGNCKHRSVGRKNYKAKYCPECGKAVK